MRDIYRYIAVDLHNPIAAERRISLIDKEIQTLKTHPAIFPLVHDDYLASKGFRMVIAEDHLIFFILREKNHAVSVMRVLYGRRDWKKLLRIETALPLILRN